MLPKTGMLPTQTLALLVCVSQAATGSATDNAQATTQAITTNDNGDDAATLPDFDGDGTIGFGDFVKFAAKFGLGQGDDRYDSQFDLLWRFYAVRGVVPILMTEMRCTTCGTYGLRMALSSLVIF